MAKACEYYNAEYVAAILRDELTARNKTRQWLADKCGVSHTSIKRIFELETPSLPMILVICKVLNLTPDYLLGYMEDPEYIGKLHHKNTASTGAEVQEADHVDY